MSQDAPTGMAERRWRVLAALLFSVFFVSTLGGTLPVAFPDLQRDLDASLAQLQWLLNAPLLATAALLLTAGSLSDLFGRGLMIKAGAVVLLVALLLCAAAPNATFLNFTAGLIGVGTAMTAAALTPLMRDLFSGRERALAFGAWAMSLHVGNAINRITGGALVEALGWRGLFAAFTIPIVITLAVIVRLRAPEVPQTRPRVDYAGLVTFAIALFAGNYVLINGNRRGFGSETIVGLTILALAALVAFIAIEARVSRRRDERRAPVLDVELLRTRALLGAALSSATSSFAAFGIAFYFALFLGNVLGDEPIAIGLHFLPLTGVAALSAIASGRLIGRVAPRHPMAGGLIAICAGAMLLRGVDATAEWTQLIPGFLVAGAGIGAVTPHNGHTAVNSVPQPRAGVASGVQQVLRSVGIALSIAGLGAILQTHVGNRLAKIPGLPEGATQQVAAARFGKPGTVAPELQARLAEAFTSGLDTLLLVIAAVTFAGACAVMALVRVGRDLASDTAPQQ